MNDAEIRAALVRHWSDVEDLDVTHEIYHDDVVLEFPQGGERLVGLANVRGMREAYPRQGGHYDQTDARQWRPLGDGSDRHL